MSNNPREAKIYGAVDTEDNIVFEGFCKRIYSSEKQEIDVFVDDLKIDTLIADNSIQKIEDKYEVYDTVGFCFKYKLPLKYIEEKHCIEFKSKDNNQLLNSPSFTADKNSPKYNENIFTYNLNNLNEDKTYINEYDKNTISILINHENVNDKNYCNYIKQLIQKYPETKFVAFYFDKKVKDYFLGLIKSNNLEFKIPKTVQEIIENSEIFINTLDEINLKTVNLIQKLSTNVVTSYAFPTTNPLKIMDISLKEFDKKLSNKEPIFDYPEKFNTSKSEIINENELIHKFYYQKVLNENNINYKINMDMNAFEFEGIESINLYLKYPEYKKAKINFNRIRKYEI